MLLILFAPLLALLSIYARQKLSISKVWVIIFILFSTVPSLLIWLNGYKYGSYYGNYVAITLFVSSILLLIFWLDGGNARSQIIPAVFIFIIFSVVILLLSFTTLVYKKTGEVFYVINTKNYQIIHSRDFDIVLYGRERATINRKAFRGFIKKTIYDDILPDAKKNNCLIKVTDKRKTISFNYCSHLVSIN